MSIYALILVTHVLIALASAATAAFSLMSPKMMSEKSALLVGTYGATLASGVALFVIMPSTLGRSCLMLALLTPAVILAARKIRAQSLQTS